MLGNFFVALAFLVPGTEKPTIVLMKTFPTVKDCREFLETGTKEQQAAHRCIVIDLDATYKGTAI